MELQLINTGQHYDYEMSKKFFDELELPDPMLNLSVGSGMHGWQIGQMLIGLEKAMIDLKPDVVLVPGDTNSTLAGALAATKLLLTLAHIEAGARSYDLRMPEEVNRRLTDHCSDLLLVVTDNCRNNLLKEGLPEDQIFLVGDTMYDALLQHLPIAMKNDILDKLDLEPKSYILLTSHRPENVDNPEKLQNIIDAIVRLHELTVLFPIHPRTMERLRRNGLFEQLKAMKHIQLIDPISYHESLKLIKNARLILTDSGGMQKEAFWLNTPCITLRKNTEWIETVELHANTLVAPDKDNIIKETRRILSQEQTKNKNDYNPFGDGNASFRIINLLKEKVKNQ